VVTKLYPTSPFDLKMDTLGNNKTILTKFQSKSYTCTSCETLKYNFRNSISKMNYACANCCKKKIHQSFKVDFLLATNEV